jgi:branched-chain amino acid transport system ATP-binding protein
MTQSTEHRVLEVSNLEGGYGPVQILNGINLHVDQGEFVTIIGPNGCGKSTFIKAIFGLASQYGGEVSHNGDDIAGWRTDKLAGRGIGYVPQTDNVFPSLTVRENMEMGGIEIGAADLIECIGQQCWLFPDLESRLNDLAASLSGGERQMLAISRALISSPTFLMLDEPTAALSPKYQQQIIGSIDGLRDKTPDFRSHAPTGVIFSPVARLSIPDPPKNYSMTMTLEPTSWVLKKTRSSRNFSTPIPKRRTHERRACDFCPSDQQIDEST